MSTRARIGIKNKKDDSIKAVFLHYDGYPASAGSTLFESFNDDTRIRDLIALGDLEALYPRLIPDPLSGHSYLTPQPFVTVARGRDCKMKGCGAVAYADRNAYEEIGTSQGEEYLYLFTGIWYVYAVETKRWKTLRNVLKDLKTPNTVL